MVLCASVAAYGRTTGALNNGERAGITVTIIAEGKEGEGEGEGEQRWEEWVYKQTNRLTRHPSSEEKKSWALGTRDSAGARSPRGTLA